MISNKVMKTEEFEDSIYYRIACSCGSDDHDMTIEFEHDKKFPSMLFVNMYKKLAWSSYWGMDNTWYKNIWKRITGAAKMLFKGYIEVEESFILKGEDHVDSFIKALEEGKVYIKSGPMAELGDAEDSKSSD